MLRFLLYPKQQGEEGRGDSNGSWFMSLEQSVPSVTMSQPHYLFSLFVSLSLLLLRPIDVLDAFNKNAVHVAVNSCSAQCNSLINYLSLAYKCI